MRGHFKACRHSTVHVKGFSYMWDVQVGLMERLIFTAEAYTNISLWLKIVISRSFSTYCQIRYHDYQNNFHNRDTWSKDFIFCTESIYFLHYSTTPKNIKASGLGGCKRRPTSCQLKGLNIITSIISLHVFEHLTTLVYIESRPWKSHRDILNVQIFQC